MKAKLTAISLAIVALNTNAQVDANPNKITIEVGAGNSVQETVRATNKTRTIKIERNPIDQMTVINPVVMHNGLKVDKSTLPPLAAGSSEFRVRSTTEVPPSSTSGAFRTVCELGLVIDDDPVVYPGQPGKSHTHSVYGNKNMNAFSDGASLLASGNSTCRGGIANRSAYWVPTMIDTQTSKPILSDPASIYYKGGQFSQSKGYGWAGPDGVWHPVIVVDPLTGLKVPKFPGFSDLPIGLKIVAGDPSKQTPYDGGKLDPFAYRWKCGNTFYTGIPQDPVACPIGATLTQEIFFPQCWDGQNLDSPDHKSHMSYSKLVRNEGDPRGWSHAECPASHPKVIPGVAFQITYRVSIDIRRFRLVSDTNSANQAGWTSHGDLFVAWDESVSKAFVENCIRKEKDCHAHLLGDGRETY